MRVLQHDPTDFDAEIGTNFGLDNALLIKSGRLMADGDGGRWRRIQSPQEYDGGAEYFGDDPWGMTYSWNDEEEEWTSSALGDAFPAVDDWVEGAIDDIDAEWRVAMQRLRTRKVSAMEVEDQPYGDALVSLGDAARAIQGAAGQLGETRRGVASGQRYRLRRLIPDLQQLASIFFRGARDAAGVPVESDAVLPELPEVVSEGSMRARFGGPALSPKTPAPSHVPVETDDGVLMVSSAAALVSEQVIEAADAIASSADSIRDWAFQHQTVDSGHPVMPSGDILKQLQSSELVQSGFKFGAATYRVLPTHELQTLLRRKRTAYARARREHRGTKTVRGQINAIARVLRDRRIH